MRSSYRATSLKIKTSLGLTLFQESKDYGEWFNKLIKYAVTMDSCQREQEPTATEDQVSSNIYGSKLKYPASVNNTSSSSTSSADDETLKRCDGFKELMQFLKEDSERQVRVSTFFLT